MSVERRRSDAVVQCIVPCQSGTDLPGVDPLVHALDIGLRRGYSVRPLEPESIDSRRTSSFSEFFFFARADQGACASLYCIRTMCSYSVTHFQFNRKIGSHIPENMTIDNPQSSHDVTKTLI